MDWGDLLNIDDVKGCTQLLVNRIKDLIKRATCERTGRGYVTPKPRSSWITQGLVISCNTKDKLYKRTKANPNNLALRDYYNTYKNKLRYLLKEAKSRYITDQIKKGDIGKSLWNFVNGIFKEQKREAVPDYLSGGPNGVISGDRPIANCFNSFFLQYWARYGEKNRK